MKAIITTDYRTERETERIIVSNPKYRVLGDVPFLTFRVAMRNGEKTDCLDYCIRGKRADYIRRFGDGLFIKGARIFHNSVVMETQDVIIMNKGVKITAFTFFPGEMVVSRNGKTAVF